MITELSDWYDKNEGLYSAYYVDDSGFRTTVATIREGSCAWRTYLWGQPEEHEVISMKIYERRSHNGNKEDI